MPDHGTARRPAMRCASGGDAGWVSARTLDTKPCQSVYHPGPAGPAGRPGAPLALHMRKIIRSGPCLPANAA
ncbi:hypothetical protein SLG_33800 [Sphingobium sp. SYK-6]|nr:hypothetical protein SLG_33800 [Sphingobium sp. SYK-6]